MPRREDPGGQGRGGIGPRRPRQSNDNSPLFNCGFFVIHADLDLIFILE